jgi:hypothetical protein
VLPTELERLEAGLKAFGHRIPADPQIATEQLVPEEEPAAEGGGSWA